MERKSLLRRIFWIAASLGVLAILSLGVVIFLNPSSVGNERFVQNINLWAMIWTIIFIIFLVLLFVLSRNLVKLYFEYRDHRPGSRIKTKLVVTFIVFSLFPALIMSLLAFGLINRNLRLWFSSPSQQLIDSSQKIAERYYQERQDRALEAIKRMAGMVLDSGGQPDLTDEAARNGFSGMRIFDPEGRLTTSLGDWPPEADTREGLEELAAGQSQYSLWRGRRPADVDHGLVGVPLISREGTFEGSLIAYFTVPDSVAFHTLQVIQAAQDYERLKGGLSRFEVNYFAILALSTLVVVFGFFWLGTYIAKKITVPLEALAVGSHQLAEGNLDHRVTVSAVDELGILVDSFNRMAEQIKESRRELEMANVELRSTNVRLEERRAYIETILQNVAAGVISIDTKAMVRTINEAALRMLAKQRDQIVGQDIRTAAPELFREFQALSRQSAILGTARREITLHRGDRTLQVAATLTKKPAATDSQSEFIMVLDDLTELIKAEKFAAWQEVARRLAHEIKNPLTPIQLSAERVRLRFARLHTMMNDWPELTAFGQVLDDGMRVIVDEARILKSLVEEFSRFARLPICKPRNVVLHRLIEQTLALYDGGLERVTVERHFDPRIDRIRIDPEQMQRVFVNLIDNALDALWEADSEKRLEIFTRLNTRRDSVTIEVSDSGIGLSAEDYENLFLPYFSTKKKGTGLGLAITRQIISEHCGLIRAEPNQPRGMRFIMELPVG